MSGFPWLTAVVVLPVAGAMVLQVIPGKASGPIKAVIAVFAAAEAVLVGMIVFAVATGAADGGGPLPMHLVEQASWIPAIGASYHLGVDGFRPGSSPSTPASSCSARWWCPATPPSG